MNNSFEKVCCCENQKENPKHAKQKTLQPYAHNTSYGVPNTRVHAGNAILASKDSEIIGWTPRVWTHGLHLLSSH